MSGALVSRAANCGAFLALITTIASAAQESTPPPGSFGVLDGFYRAMQLQGNLVILGQGLVTPPAWLQGGDLDVRYQSKAHSPDGKEVMFADTIVINRFLGGQWSDFLNGEWSGSFNQQMQAVVPLAADTAYPWRSLDYFRSIPPSTPSGKDLFFGNAARGDLIDARLQPYLHAGYGFADITLMLSDIPWDASAEVTTPTPYCLAPPGQLNVSNYPATGGFNSGDDENCMPDAFPRLWQAIIAHLTRDLIAHYGADNASRFGFEMGDEWDSRQSVNMSATQYRHIYEGAYSTIHALLPNAQVLPGDFSGSGNEPLNRGVPGKVYDTPAFLVQEDEAGMQPAYVPRSLNTGWRTPNPGEPNSNLPSPMGTVNFAVASYQTITDSLKAAGLPAEVIPEIHQFGLLGFPPPVGGTVVANDESSITANFTFQALMGLKQYLNPRRVTHWDTTVYVPAAGGITLLNGIGFTYLILDHYRGAHLYDLQVAKVHPSSDTAEVRAIALWRAGETAVVVSNFDVGNDATPSRIRVTIPRDLLEGRESRQLRYLRYSLSPVDDAFVAIKADMLAAGLLSNAFQNCALCYGSPQTMTVSTNYIATVDLVGKNWPSYRSIMERNLRWRRVDDGSLDQNGITHDLSHVGDTLAVTLGPDEMLILDGSADH
jgi:hypothetical protein